MLVRRQSLVFNSQASSATGISAPAITDTNPNPPAPVTASPTLAPSAAALTNSASASAFSSPTQQPGAASSAPHSTINLGTVIGACLGSFALLIVLIFLAVWHSRRSRKSIQLRERRSKRDNWNKLVDNPRDSRRSSFESKPSLPHSSLDYTAEYPPVQAKALPSQSSHLHPRYVLPAHPYSSNLSISPTPSVETKDSLAGNPFADPNQRDKGMEVDVASVYSTASNPFESIYNPPAGSTNRINSPEGYSGSPFFTPHPDSSVQGEKWGSVGKERNVQESFASSGTDKLGSLIAALDLGGSSNNEEEKADRSMHGHLGKLDT